MSGIMIVGGAGFVGSNLAGYFIQHTKSMMSTIDNLSCPTDLRNLQPAITSKSRHTFYLMRAEDVEMCRKALEIEKPRVVIFNLADNIASGQLPSDLPREWRDICVQAGVQRLVFLGGKDLKNANQVLQAELLALVNDEDIKCDVIMHCDLFGPRQSVEAPIAKFFVDAISDHPTVPSDDTKKEVMYIKDFYDELVKMINSDEDGAVHFIRSNKGVSYKKVGEFLNSLAEGEEATIESSTVDLDRGRWEGGKTKLAKRVYDIDKILEHTLSWYNQNRWAWKVDR